MADFGQFIRRGDKDVDGLFDHSSRRRLLAHFFSDPPKSQGSSIASTTPALDTIGSIYYHLPTWSDLIWSA